MSTLLLLLPPRERLRSQGLAESQTAPTSLDAMAWHLSPDGRQLGPHGRGLPLPAASEVVLVLADADVAWRRTTVPKAGRLLRQALAGLLEESLLDDADDVHFALSGDSSNGEPWIALCSRPWLARQLAALEAAQVRVDRIVPSSWPGEASVGHFDDGQLHWSHAEGVASLPVEGSLTRQLIAPHLETTAWTASPASAAAAQSWLGADVAVRSNEQRALAAASSPWNLAQFEFAPRARGLQLARQILRQAREPRWKALRWGLAALLVIQLLGLNLIAFKDRKELETRKSALTSTLTQTYPQVRAVLDAPAQMRRETEALRVAAGLSGDGDLEALLGAAAAAWPQGLGPAEGLSFEPGKLSISSTGWNPAQIDAFSQRLRGDGWQVENKENQMVLSRAKS
ncbi:type II secretion system protein GspL [Burkholderiaceae bacterium UC74_6]